MFIVLNDKCKLLEDLFKYLLELDSTHYCEPNN